MPSSEVYCRHPEEPNGPGAVMSYRMSLDASSTHVVTRYRCPSCGHITEVLN